MWWNIRNESSEGCKPTQKDSQHPIFSVVCIRCKCHRHHHRCRRRCWRPRPHRRHWQGKTKYIAIVTAITISFACCFVWKPKASGYLSIIDSVNEVDLQICILNAVRFAYSIKCLHIFHWREFSAATFVQQPLEVINKKKWIKHLFGTNKMCLTRMQRQQQRDFKLKIYPVSYRICFEMKSLALLPR